MVEVETECSRIVEVLDELSLVSKLMTVALVIVTIVVGGAAA